MTRERRDGNPNDPPRLLPHSSADFWYQLRAVAQTETPLLTCIERGCKDEAGELCRTGCAMSMLL
jgi:hypothetical protein